MTNKIIFTQAEKYSTKVCLFTVKLSPGREREEGRERETEIVCYREYEKIGEKRAKRGLTYICQRGNGSENLLKPQCYCKVIQF